MQSEVLKGSVDVLLLSVLRTGEAHGYRIVELVREQSEGAFDLAEGTVYPALYRLERAGELASRWETVGGRRRRVYRLTRRGRRELVRRRREWEAYSRAMGAALA
ncbi:MAG: helix-turn-helix transcriptional regulator [Actinobacteria bacterium]|nr:helix-turn-helix transcriptional regulator [Actinomycetota bacterium]